MTEAKTPKPIKPEDAGFALAAYRQMLFLRRFEQRCLDLSTATPPVIAGSLHLCAGQEAIPAGAMAALQPQDNVVATYRGHGWALAGRLGAEEVLAEICHRATGVNGGRAGSALITAPWAGFIGENSIVGAGGPIACGVALAAQRRKTGGVVLVSFGDGATSQGALHESLVFAAAYDLPVIFLCENNGWSELTASAAIIKVDRLAKRAGGYGMAGVTIDGSDPLAVRDTIAQAAERARSGRGPSFVECRVGRLWGHYNRDIEHYRPKEDKAAAVAQDPILLLGQRLQQSGMADEPALSKCQAEVEQEIAALEARVLDAATPDPGSARLHVVAAKTQMPQRCSAPTATAAETHLYRRRQRGPAAHPGRGRTKPPLWRGRRQGRWDLRRLAQSATGIRRGSRLRHAHRRGGHPGLRRGRGASGLRPVVEIMWADFLLVALDQIINQAANIRYVTQGRASLPHGDPHPAGHDPRILRPAFAIPGGPAVPHSRIHLGLPATPQDAYDMLRVAAAAEDPVVLIEGRGLYQRRAEVDFDRTPEPMGTARLARPGSDLAIITWGTSVPEAMEAADQAAATGIETAVLDLRWLSPLDETAIASVVARCGGRVLIVHEANRTGGVGAEIAARITEADRSALVRRLGAPDIRMPASPVLQAALLPKAGAILSAIRALVESCRAPA